MPETNKDGRVRGGRNLILLGLGSIAIAFVTTAISLCIYRATGDIYFDCSRPGFVCKTEKKEDGKEGEEEKFSGEGEITLKDIDEYIRLYNDSTEYIYNSTDSFSPEVLSDETLGIIDDGDEQIEYTD